MAQVPLQQLTHREARVNLFRLHALCRSQPRRQVRLTVAVVRSSLKVPPKVADLLGAMTERLAIASDHEALTPSNQELVVAWFRGDRTARWKLVDRGIVDQAGGVVSEYAHHLLVERLGATRVVPPSGYDPAAYVGHSRRIQGVVLPDEPYHRFQVRAHVRKAGKPGRWGIEQSAEEWARFAGLVGFVFSEQFEPLEVWSIPKDVANRHASKLYLRVDGAWREGRGVQRLEI